MIITCVMGKCYVKYYIAYPILVCDTFIQYNNNILII